METLERLKAANKRLSETTRRLGAEVERLRKALVDNWGDVPGELVYTKDTKEIHCGH